MIFVNDIGIVPAAATASGRKDKKEKKDRITEQDVEYRVNSGIPPADETGEVVEGTPPFDWQWRKILVGEPQGPFQPPNLPPWRTEFRVDKQEIVPGGVGVYDPHATIAAVGEDEDYALDVAR